LAFELLVHGYFGIYTNGWKYWFLTPYDFFLSNSASSNLDDQEFIVRRTKASYGFLKGLGIDLTKEIAIRNEAVPEAEKPSDLEKLKEYNLYDVWVKSLDLNVVFTEAGQFIYQQPFPYPKVYPFFIGRLSELMNTFYPIPVMGQLIEVLKEYQKGEEHIIESASSIAKPILVYDADSGIDVDKLLSALKFGYKHIIVGKNREGDINFRAPGQLPAYAQNLPNAMEEKLASILGINQSFFGRTGAARERGAISRLFKASFRSLATMATTMEEAFTQLDEYLLLYLQAHQFRSGNEFKYLNLEEIFAPGKTRYIPSERLKAFSLEDTYEDKMLAQSSWRAKLIPQELALEEQGYTQPKKIMRQIKNEMQALIDLQKGAQTAPIVKPSLIDQIHLRLNGKLKYTYWLSPLAEDKVIVKVTRADKLTSAFLLSDLSDHVMIELSEEKIEPPVEQKEPGIPVPEKVPEIAPTGLPATLMPEAPIEKKAAIQLPVVETRGRPATNIPTAEQLKQKLTAIKLPESSVEHSSPVTPSKVIPKVETAFFPPNEFSQADLESYIKISKPIAKAQERYFLNLPGLYIVEPHAKWIFEGKKVLLVKAKKFNIIGVPHLLCGKLVYGVITVKRIIENFDFDALQKYHMVTPAERSKWWGDAPLYLYMFIFQPFEKPLEYLREPGVQTFIDRVKVLEEATGVPQRGDLKPVVLKPEIIPPSHKPEKKAFQSHEVFSVDRLKDLIPEGKYDVSSKMDGLRTFAWVVNGKAKLFSDEGNEFTASRVQPVLDALVEKFKHTVLLDGEILMEGVERKDIAGYIHGLFKPSEDQLKSLHYVCWDILYVRDKSLAAMPFIKRSAILDLYLPLQKDSYAIVRRVKHVVVNREDIPKIVKSVASNEGIVIRDIDASYWATHSTYKMKFMYDIDAKVIAIEKTKLGLPIYFCALQDGTFIGQTYAQGEVKAKVGDVIRVNVDHITIRPDGSINWYSPKPKSFKEAKLTPGKGLRQVGQGGPDTLALAKEVYLSSGGSEDKWNAWLPKHETWKKDVMPGLIKKYKEKTKAGVEASKT
jgi:hypothetical protein